MKLTQAQNILNAQLIGNDVTYQDINTDTRTLKPGDLFIAIKGETLDGHDYIQEAEAKQAAAIIVSDPVTSTLPMLLVEDTTKALGTLAAHHREKFTLPIIGITGSCGKTTTKSLLANILSQQGETLSNKRSFNNHIGVPVTLLELNKNHQYAVIEMGTNHFGEISYVTHIAKPTIALITNAAPVHLEGLQSIEGVSRAKGEIFEGLPSDGIGIINADDPFASFWSTLIAPRKILTFSVSQTADVYAKNIHCNNIDLTTFTLVTPQGEILIELPLLGEHNVANATAAACVASSLSVSLEAIARGIKMTEPVNNRLRTCTGYNGVQIIDDSYNANPVSFRAAVHILANQPGKKILVSGDMAELATEAKHYHQALGIEAKNAGIEAMYTYGQFSQYTAESFGENAQHFLDQQQLIDTLKPLLNPQTTVLIKGSRSMHMEKIVAALCE